MSQQQPRKPACCDQLEEPIKYGDIFPHVEGDLANKPVTPEDAAALQAAETVLLGKTLHGGAAATIQSAAAKNERAGLVGRGKDVGDQIVAEDVITNTDLVGAQVLC